MFRKLHFLFEIFQKCLNGICVISEMIQIQKKNQSGKNSVSYCIIMLVKYELKLFNKQIMIYTQIGNKNSDVELFPLDIFYFISI